MLPPVLEIYVIFHPGDATGLQIAHELFEHFHGTTFSGLIGGAVAVYFRSHAWPRGDGPPRIILLPEDEGSNGTRPAQLVVLVPVLSVSLARELETGGDWCEYMQRLIRAQASHPQRVAILPIWADNAQLEGSRLFGLFEQYQQVGTPLGGGGSEPPVELQCRDIAQGIVQFIGGAESRLQVFISHTGRTAPGEEDVPELIQLVKEIIGETHLRRFFDANDLQPGRNWDDTLRREAAKSALLSIRTDLYASRAWCQREMLIAKAAGMPIVILDSLGRGEERGSFLMDHLPRIPVREIDGRWSKPDIRRSLNLLVDECLKRAVWNLQRKLALDSGDLGVSWWAPHAPEPVTLAAWLQEQQQEGVTVVGETDLLILHPDPPLGLDERESLTRMVRLMGHRGGFEIMTPRGLAARGAYA